MTRRESFSSGLKSGDKGPDIQLLSLAAPIRHALHALGLLAARGEGAGAAQIARALRLPSAALSKSFQRLASKGILESRRGPGGGYRLRLAPAATSLADVAAALEDGAPRGGRCLLEERECRPGAPCALHGAATEADGRLRRALARLTLADLAESLKERAEAR